MKLFVWIACFLLGAFVVTVPITGKAMTPSSNNSLIAQQRSERADAAAIKKVVTAQQNHTTPGWKFNTNVFIDGSYAVASVYDQVTGGAYVLKKVNGNWRVLSSGGGGYSVEKLVQVGVPRLNAEKLFQLQSR